MTQDLKMPELKSPRDPKAIRREKKIRLRDKIIFFLSFINLIVMVATIFGKPALYPYWHAFFVTIMLIHRFFEFKAKKWHYYLLDFCYLVNSLVIIYILAFPKSLDMYLAVFMLGMGPIYWAIPVYRLSFVFHNTEKITSFLIHSSPALALWVIRWYDHSGVFIGVETLDSVSFGFDFVWRVMKLVNQYYLTWAIVYCFILFVWRKKVIDERGYETLFNYTMRGNENGSFFSNKKFGLKWAPLMFMINHAIWVIVISLCTQVLFFNYYAGLVVIILLHLQGIWNGAGYYIDYFSRTYVNQFKTE